MPMIKLFRCTNQNCQAKEMGRFESDLPDDAVACPQCGKKKSDPRFGALIQRLMKVHFDPPSDVPGYGLGWRACDPSTPIQIPYEPTVRACYHAGTGVAAHVTCPECKKTEAYLKALGESMDEEVANASWSRHRSALGAA